MEDAREFRIIGAYHVATFPGWQTIAEAQCERLKRSGLLQISQKVLVGVVGDDPSAAQFLEESLGSAAVVRHFGPVERFEFPTLQRLFEEAQAADFNAWYLHTKGVSNPCEGSLAHRLQMEAVVIDNYRACHQALGEFDLSGARWLPAQEGEYGAHFTGNFWWATSEYLRTLPPPESLPQWHRYAAEFWVGMNEQARPCEIVPLQNPWSRPSAWVGLEERYADLCELTQRSEIRRVVEIGVDYGFSAFHFARDFPAAEIIGIDDFSLHSDSESWVRSHLPLFPNLKIRKGSSAELGRNFGQPICVLHIDGDHAFESVLADFCAWMPWVRPGGCVLFHDLTSFESVRQFFDLLGGRKREISECHGLGCWFKD